MRVAVGHGGGTEYTRRAGTAGSVGSRRGARLALGGGGGGGGLAVGGELVEERELGVRRGGRSLLDEAHERLRLDQLADERPLPLGPRRQKGRLAISGAAGDPGVSGDAERALASRRR